MTNFHRALASLPILIEKGATFGQCLVHILDNVETCILEPEEYNMVLNTYKTYKTSIKV
jgi:hypothetical protein